MRSSPGAPAAATPSTTATTDTTAIRRPSTRVNPPIRHDDRGVESLRGQLLIASPTLVEPTFRRTVVLVGEHNEEGALGVVLNRPAGASVEEAAPPLAGLAGEGERLFVGGPVQPQGAVVLAQVEYPDAAGLLVFDSIGFLIGDVDPDELVGGWRDRGFAGYAGGGGGQLEAENEMWAGEPEPARPEDGLPPDPQKPWGPVLPAED